MEKIICICGAPRARITFLFQCAIAHPFLMGEVDGPWRTNEPEGLMHEAMASGDYTKLKALYDHWITGPEQRIVVKAPGYLFAEEFFKNNPYELEPVFLIAERAIEEIVLSNLEYPDAITHVQRALVKTDCPKDQIDKYAAVWPTADVPERVAMRAMWHLEATPPAGALSVVAGDYAHPTALSRRICSFCGVPMHTAVTKKIKEFETTEYPEESLASVAAMIENLTTKLSA